MYVAHSTRVPPVLESQNEKHRYINRCVGNIGSVATVQAIANSALLPRSRTSRL